MLENFEIKQLRGQQTTREKTLKNYRNGNLNILYLNSVLNASGLNLTCTTDIIIIHTMDKATTDQVIGRAIRIGCQNDVTVHQLQPKN